MGPRAVTSPDRHSHVKLAEPPEDLPEISPEESFLIFPEYSDEAIASLFTVRYVEELRYVAALGKWLVNDGQRWKYDDRLTAFDKVRKMCIEVGRRIVDDIKLDKKVRDRLAAEVGSAKKVAAVERLARADPRLAMGVDDFDVDPMLLNTPEGYVDLESGDLCPHESDRYFTKITQVVPGGNCVLWLKLIKKWTNNNKKLAAFLQRFAGYVLTGLIKEHTFLFFYGLGANGKSTFLNALREILRDYCVVAPMEMFMQARGDRHPADLAMLRGARLVIAQEVEKGRPWATSRIKGIVAGDPLSARFMRQDFFTFQPQCKLILAGNHRPGLVNVDEAMRRRLNLVPFTVTIAPKKRDPNIPVQLREEYPGILRWMIEGCLLYQEHGLKPPKVVTDATDEYFSSEDVLGQWVSENTEGKTEEFTLTKELHANYKYWAAIASENAMSERKFSQAMDERGFKRDKHPINRRHGFKGIRLKPRIGDIKEVL